MEGLTPEIATEFLKNHNNEQSELCLKEINEVLKKHNREIDVILSMDENEKIRKQIVLKKI